MISTAEKLSRLETKIEKRKAAIAEETKKLNADLGSVQTRTLQKIDKTKRKLTVWKLKSEIKNS